MSMNGLYLLIGAFLVVGVVVYIFYPALVAAASPHIASQQEEVQKAEASREAAPKRILLSLVIPAYNEQDRLTQMLQEAYSYLTSPDCPALRSLAAAASPQDSATEQASSLAVEFILVDDGSRDNTIMVYRQFCHQVATRRKTRLSSTTIVSFRLVRLSTNRGKGAAVQAGMMAAVGGIHDDKQVDNTTASFMLMVDADGATEFGPGLAALATQAATHDCILGSRATTDDHTVKRSRLRQALQAGFHWLVVFLVGMHKHNTAIRDTQCGFKLFRGSIVSALFGDLHLRRWAFDTELLYRARDLRLAEVPVPWHEVAGSKLHTGPLSLARVAVGMLRDMLCVRLCYTLGIWRLPSMETTKKEQ